MAQLLALNLLAFLIALSLGYSVSSLVRGLRRRGRPTVQTPSVGSLLRIRASGAMYRSRFLGADRRGWRFAAPIQRGAFVPLRVGEGLVVEATEGDERLLFRSVILERDADTGEMTMRPPVRVYASQRLYEGSPFRAEAAETPAPSF